jgi:hypothetical protein
MGRQETEWYTSTPRFWRQRVEFNHSSCDYSGRLRQTLMIDKKAGSPFPSHTFCASIFGGPCSIDALTSTLTFRPRYC